VLAAGILIGVSAHWLLSGPAREPQPAPTAAASPAAGPVPKPQPGPVAEAQPAPAANPPPTPAPQPAAEPKPEPMPVAAPPPALAPASLLSESQLQRIQRYSARGQPLLAERLAATRELLARAPDDAYALELYVTDNTDQARVERFLTRARDLVPLADVHVIPIVGAPTRLWVVFGWFPSRQAAVLAQKSMPPKYQREFKTVPRSFAEIRHAL